MDGVPRFNVVLRCFFDDKVFIHEESKSMAESDNLLPIMRYLLNVVQKCVNNRDATLSL
jgi:hypothetical protein